MAVRVLEGDCRDVLRTLPDCSAQCCVTSPPYFGLRDYGCDGQLGLEPSPDEYVAQMVSVFREVRRVLRDDGTLWLNIGDSYAATGKSGGGAQGERWEKAGAQTEGPRGGKWSPAPKGLKPKDLIGIPWLLAFALRADGWYLRSEIIWHKPNPMPESVRDRPTKAHEQVFLLTKSARYFYDAEGVREGRTSDEDATEFRGGCYVGGNTDNATVGKRKAVGNKRVKVPSGWDRGDGAHGTIHREGRTSAEYQDAPVAPGRNARSVWTVATAPFAEAHFATFPPKLAQRCIKAGSKPGDVVLDPFGGAGTTGVVADRLQRDAVLIELNPEYAAMARRRIGQDAPLFGEVA